ncbi:hypothetical protein DSO57_1002636 [Entomophthora muscae]|uniref:Uncharacterized protein n=1 Tax=Entomophthora muscae TaxID=34485 RepID=A0ACC2SXZ3_9FUNG|nr:hypothetical protein DSO57_1002636 [Entomophthora muscae]
MSVLEFLIPTFSFLNYLLVLTFQASRLLLISHVQTLMSSQYKLMTEEIGPTLTSNPGKPKSLLDFLSETPYTAWVTSASLLTSYPWATSRGIVKLPGMPTRGSAIAFSILFAGTGALSASGDIINSTGIATGMTIHLDFFAH